MGLSYQLELVGNLVPSFSCGEKLAWRGPQERAASALLAGALTPFFGFHDGRSLGGLARGDTTVPAQRGLGMTSANCAALNIRGVRMVTL
jgi:hypothetical protein